MKVKTDYDEINLDKAFDKLKAERTDKEKLVDIFVLVSSGSAAVFLVIYALITHHSEFALAALPFIWTNYFYYTTVYGK